MPENPNRLINETSPYLLQHAHNPVDWYPWGPEALQRAREQKLPILLSVGYAACHWCHVMEKESFEDEETAALMNRLFVCIKVDREERPDIDSIYMDALQMMTGHGGWPMTMFLTPEGKPFYGGTYYPPEARHGLPSLRQVLRAISDSWGQRGTEIANQANQISAHLVAASKPMPSTEPLHDGLLTQAVRTIGRGFDEKDGGFGGPPKFPQAPVLEFMLRAAHRGTSKAREMIELTLRKMALGGIFDQLGGGFHRYSVDAEWLVPHFEKMLYDNAQLARVYTRAWQIFKDPLYKRVTEETIGYLIRDMRSKEGGFFSSEDADSDGVEGKFYVWSFDEFSEIAIDPEVASYYGVTELGNFEGRNILTAATADPPGIFRDQLLERRAGRVRPGRDEKVLASWNGLAISALTEAGAALHRRDFLEAARQAAGFVLDKMRSENKRLFHSYKDGRARVNGLLEDYAYMTEGLLALYETTFEPVWANEARLIANSMVEVFNDGAGGFFTTGADLEDLIVRQKELIESATPSPNAVASLCLQKLAVLFGDPGLARSGAEVLRFSRTYMEKVPQAAGTHLCALDFYLSTPQEIVVIGPQADERTGQLLAEVWSRFIPNKVVAGTANGKAIESPMLEGKKQIDGAPTAFVCERYACKEPVTDPTKLAAQLGG